MDEKIIDLTLSPSSDGFIPITVGGVTYRIGLASTIAAAISAVITTGVGAPVTPGNDPGNSYYDTTNNNLYVWDGSAWNIVGFPISVVTSIPLSAGTANGELAVNTTNAEIYVWDGAGTTWRTNQATGGGGPTGPALTAGTGAPVTAGITAGDIYIRTSNGDTYYWTGAAWSLINFVQSSSSASGTNDNKLARYDGSTGKVIQVSGVTLSDANAMTGLTSLTSTAINGTNGTITNLTTTTLTVGGVPITSAVNQKIGQATWTAGGGSSTLVVTDAFCVAGAIISELTVVSGTQVGVWEKVGVTAGQFTVNSSASETGTIVFNYMISKP